MKLSGLVETAFARLATLRSARVFHPVGVTFSGTMEISDTASRTADALGTGTWSVGVRASKGIGTPNGWPDFYGIAVRLANESGPVDLLFTTVARTLPYLLAPARGWGSHPYSTFLPYRVANEHRILLRLEAEQPDRTRGGSAASLERVVSEGPVSFALCESAGWDWKPVGRLTIASVSNQQIAFDPVVNEHPRLRHSVALRALRSWAYIGSRRGRAANSADVTRQPRRATTQSPSGAEGSSAISNSSSQELQR
jgi:hypothetical protein